MADWEAALDDTRLPTCTVVIAELRCLPPLEVLLLKVLLVETLRSEYVACRWRQATVVRFGFERITGLLRVLD